MLLPSHSHSPPSTYPERPHEYTWTNLELVITSGSPTVYAAAIDASKWLLARLVQHLQDVAGQKQIEGAPDWALCIRQFQEKCRVGCGAAPFPEVGSLSMCNGAWCAGAKNTEIAMLEAKLYRITEHGNVLDKEITAQDTRCQTLHQRYTETQKELQSAIVQLDMVAAKCRDFMRGLPSGRFKERPKEYQGQNKDKEKRGEKKKLGVALFDNEARLELERQKHEAREEKRKKRKLRREIDAAHLELQLRNELNRHDELTQKTAELHIVMGKAEDQAALLDFERDNLNDKSATVRTQLAVAVAQQRDRTMLQGVLQILVPLSTWVANIQADVYGSSDKACLLEMDQALAELRQNLACAARHLTTDLYRIMEEDVLAKMHMLLKACSEKAPMVATTWSLSELKGGMSAKVYRAVCINGYVPLYTDCLVY